MLPSARSTRLFASVIGGRCGVVAGKNGAFDKMEVGSQALEATATPWPAAKLFPSQEWLQAVVL
jgi:hypothetical protein